MEPIETKEIWNEKLINEEKLLLTNGTETKISQRTKRIYNTHICFWIFLLVRFVASIGISVWCEVSCERPYNGINQMNTFDSVEKGKRSICRHRQQSKFSNILSFLRNGVMVHYFKFRHMAQMIWILIPPFSRRLILMIIATNCEPCEHKLENCEHTEQRQHFQRTDAIWNICCSVIYGIIYYLLFIVNISFIIYCTLNENQSRTFSPNH